MSMPRLLSMTTDIQHCARRPREDTRGWSKYYLELGLILIFRIKTDIQHCVQGSGGGHENIIRRLLSAGADVNAPAARHADGHTALQAAARAAHGAVVERLLRAGADVNAPGATSGNGRTALQAAARGGHSAVVERLLQAGVHDTAMEIPNCSGCFKRLRMRRGC